MQVFRRQELEQVPTSRFGLVVKQTEDKDNSFTNTSKSYAKLASLGAEIALFSTVPFFDS